MKLKVKRIIFAILVIINCVIIYKFSGQNSEESSQTSGFFVDKIVSIIVDINKSLNKESITDMVTFFVRKTAHFSIYALLGVWLMNEANTFQISKRRKIIICLIFGCLYAISDELHQSFVGGRSAEIRDVCIDTCGVLFGTFFVIIFCNIVKKIINKKSLKLGNKTVS